MSEQFNEHLNSEGENIEEKLKPQGVQEWIMSILPEKRNKATFALAGLIGLSSLAAGGCNSQERAAFLDQLKKAPQNLEHQFDEYNRSVQESAYPKTRYQRTFRSHTDIRITPSKDPIDVNQHESESEYKRPGSLSEHFGLDKDKESDK